MGKLKQLLPYAGETLLGKAVDSAREAGLHPLTVVVGAEADAIQASLAAKPVDIVRNPDWRLGMGSSIRAGAEHLASVHGEIGGVIILAADQPRVQAKHLQALRRALYETGADIVAAAYADTLGIPAAFQRRILNRLKALPPSSGAKALLQDAGLRVEGFPLPEAEFDIDTPDDWDRLVSANR